VLVRWWPLRLVASVVTALTMVRAFILVHDAHHGAIFRDAPLAKGILSLYGLLLLTPGRIWRETHNDHHAHTARMDGAQRGTFTLYTTQRWRQATRMERLRYRIERHPLTLLLGYLTVFVGSFGLAPFLRRPLHYADSGLALLLHGAVGAAAFVLGGPDVFVYAFLLPFLLSGVAGAYLFYVQHNFEGMRIPSPDAWTRTRAALEACSYLKLGPVMRWFTGNIGLHHVHHLNPRIPFYRLPSAMAAIPALQHAVVVRLRPREVWRSLRLKLWDPEAGRMVGYGA
jgi:omega-6 fatty acid desaturase (delta-12 desaturase)